MIVKSEGFLTGLRAVLLCAALAGSQVSRAVPPLPKMAKPSCGSVSAETCAVAEQLGRGINLGNMLDSPKEGDWGLTFEPEYADLIASSFQHVRLPVRWSTHAPPTADQKLAT